MFKIYNLDDDDVISYPFKLTQFPGGEPHVVVDGQYITNQNIWIDARVRNGQEFMSLLCLLDAISYHDPRTLSLFLPYFPGARQDRYEGGSCYTAGVYAAALAPYAIDDIVIVDPHSDVIVNELLQVAADVNPVAAEDVFKIDASKYVGVICPDKGAIKRTQSFAAKYGLQNNIIYCRKTRDPETGKLSGFESDMITVPGKYLMVDDICDGGGTFLGLANRICKNHDIPATIADPVRLGDFSMDLCVTHGIFSKGVLDLLQVFDKIITTDSFRPDLKMGPYIQTENMFWVGLRAMKGTLHESNVAN